jgi:transposase-like protein
MRTEPPREMTTFFINPNDFIISQIYLLHMRCCPRCKSTEIYEVAGGYIGQVYRCKQCGYRGSFILELDEDEEKEQSGGE